MQCLHASVSYRFILCDHYDEDDLEPLDPYDPAQVEAAEEAKEEARERRKALLSKINFERSVILSFLL